MKTTQQIGTMALLVGALSLGACGTGNEADRMERAVDKELSDLDQALDAGDEAERQELIADLREMQLKLERRIHKLENELEEGGVTETERKELEAEKSTYMEQQRRIETEVNDVTQATRKTWNDVKNGTEKVVNDVGDWIDRQVENVDEATKADTDKDGH
ncbi:MAG TPA: hypothetical protein PK499_10970 [Flavobacteriales bacterium]|nr:hypothetical protein [Flavobacteriales bacterium]HPQ59192.1 hypothetical protein [Flavobacteriales bacterium]